MGATEIKKTKKYEMFTFFDGNRPVSKARVRGIVEKIKRKNLLQDCPLLCRRENGSLIVLEGQGRLEAAKYLGLPVYYRVTKDLDEDDVAEINEVTQWRPRNFLHYWLRRGTKAQAKEYAALAEYTEKTGMPIYLAISLLSGLAAESGLERRRFKRGMFQVKETELAYRVGHLIAEIKKAVPATKATRNMMTALAWLVQVPAFDDKKFLHKLSYLYDEFTPQNTVAKYLEMISNIYKYKTPAALRVHLPTEVDKLKAKARA